MKSWKKLRIPFLSLTLGGTLFVLVQGTLAPPSVKKFVPQPLVFPTDVPLPQWQSLASEHPGKIEVVKLGDKVHYRYRRNGQTLEVVMTYMGYGDVRSFLRHSTLPPSFEVRGQKDTGYYGLLADQQQAYLTACINPTGSSTVTNSQQLRELLQEATSLDRFLPWLVGQKRLLDQRCLWVLMSVPLEESSSEAAYQTLAKVWPYWYQFWQPIAKKLS